MSEELRFEYYTIHTIMFIILEVSSVFALITDRLSVIYSSISIFSVYYIILLTILLPISLSPPSLSFGVIFYLIINLTYYFYIIIELLFIYYNWRRNSKLVIYFGFCISGLPLISPIIISSIINYQPWMYEYLLLPNQTLFLLSLLFFCVTTWLCFNSIQILEKDSSMTNIIINMLKKNGKEILIFPILVFLLYTSFELFYLFNFQFTIFLIAGGALLSLGGYIFSEYFYLLNMIGGSLICGGTIIVGYLDPTFTLWFLYFPTVILVLISLVGIIYKPEKFVET